MYILVHKYRGMCFDLVENIFPVSPDFVWVDVGALDVMPDRGWSASKIDGIWQFTDPNPPQAPEAPDVP